MTQDCCGRCAAPAAAEDHFALREAYRNPACDEYFAARADFLDTRDRRIVFEAGFDRGFDAATALDALAAEVERSGREVVVLRKQLAEMMLDRDDDRAEVERLTRELAAARADAERYRWLRDRAPLCPARRPVVWMTVSHDGDAPDTHETWLDDDELDVAVDAAREAAK